MLKIIHILILGKNDDHDDEGNAINDLNGKEIIETFDEEELQKTNQKEFRIETVIKRKGDKLYVKKKGHDNSFNSWIDKKDLV